jgi:saxitoxin biosynthesis operon SxtJ-like protein
LLCSDPNRFFDSLCEQHVGHESYDRRQDVQGSSNRSFGLVFAAVFAAIGLLPLIHGGAVRIWALAVAALFLATAFLFPSALGALNRLWLKFGLLLHKIVSPVVLGIMFFLVITPIGMYLRARGKDPLRLKPNKQSKSYWIERVPPGPAPESIKDQF